jgi:serine/threonine protein kinase/formylglycine-generating enzyme required for sulfatase activity
MPSPIRRPEPGARPVALPPRTPAPASLFSPPSSFDGYVLSRKIGQGNMGQVFLAVDTLLDRPVALKFISVAEADADARQRFLVEARAIARLAHPNVVAIYRVGEVAGHPYLASEFVRGEGLDQLALPVPWARALAIGVGVARGLAAAHRRGVVHRDIKPANILLSEEGEPKLLDFGIAKLLALDPEAAAERARGHPTPMAALDQGASPEATICPRPLSILAHRAGVALEDSGERLQGQLTLPGEAMGTPLYMAPEIWRGDDATFRSDVYSLGALLHALTVGHPPHRARTLGMLRARVLDEDAPALARLVSGVDPRFAAVVDRCLRRDPAERFASADELCAALQQLTPEARADVLPDGNPYRSLHAFEAEHSALFFGRDAEIRSLLERLRNEPCLAVAGDSGVGKSSLCRAGVLPRIASWLGGSRAFSTVSLVPGERPIAALASALAPLLGVAEAALCRTMREDPAGAARELRGRLGKDRGLVVFVDQLEELVTLCEPREAEAAAALLGWLAAPSASLRLLVTVRGDFLVRVAALPTLGDAVAGSLYVLRPLGAERIREAIVGPAQALRVAFESEAMIDALVAPTVRAEGGLPLLQFALAELWEARDPARRILPASALAAMGGVAGALGRHADDVLARMMPSAARAARRVLLRLVTAAGTRGRRTDEELVAGLAHGRAALDALVRGRLVVARQSAEGAGYEIAHEALLHGWGTLAAWLSSGTDTRAARQRLAAAALEWRRLDQARETLWSARQLAELASVDPDELTPDERAFLGASRMRSRRARWLRGAALLALPLTLGAAYGGVAYQTRRALSARIEEHTRQAEEALVQARAARAEASALRQRSFARFDAFERAEAEETWARALALGASLDASYGGASQQLETALMLDPSRPELRARFADLLYERALSAEEQRNELQKQELLRRLAVYDDAQERARRFAAPATLILAGKPPGGSIRIARAGEGEASANARPVEREIEPGAEAAIALDPGSYVLTFRAPTRVTARYPLTLARGERVTLALDLPPAASVPAGFVYVPPGRFLFGSAAEDHLRSSFFNTAPLHEVRTAAYLIALRETTFADWFDYLRALPAAARPAHYPSVDTGGFRGALVFRELAAGGFELAFQPAGLRLAAASGERVSYPGRSRRASQDWRRFPVFGINIADAEAYLGWLAASGRVKGARLCTEHEWERAARGSDDRPFPHGARLEPDDADFDETYAKGPLALGPDEVGSHPASRSPFGLDDMAGNVWEWTRSSIARGEYVARGGSYYFDANSSRSDNRQVSEPSLRDASVGLRVCADAPPIDPRTAHAGAFRITSP